MIDALRLFLPGARVPVPGIRRPDRTLAVLLFCLVMLAGITGFSAVSLADDSLTIEKRLSFGDITAHPKGDRIIINASAGSASPFSQNGYSHISNGTSGLLLLDSSETGKYIQMVYPDELVLRCQEDLGKTMSIDEFLTYSTPGFIVPDHAQEIHIGGRLTINPNQYPCEYSGDLLIILVY